MSRHRGDYEFGPGGYSGYDERRQLKLSGLIQQRLAASAEKHRQRTRLVHAVIMAQAILTAATTAGYLGERSATLHLAIGVASVALYLAALVTSALLRQMNAAAYLLVGGGLVAVAAQTISLAAEPNPALTAQAALLFIALTFEASLLFTPEVTLLVAFISTVLSAVAILFTLSLDPSIDKGAAYLLMVYPVGLQALAGIIAWVVALSAIQSATEAAREDESHFAEARLQAMTAQRAELDEQVAALQQAIMRALGGESEVHVDVGEGALAPLAESLNVLLQRVAELSQAYIDLSRMGAASLVINDVLTQMDDVPTPTPTPSSLPIMTNTPLDSVQLRLAQTQVNLNMRIARMQRLATDLLGLISDGQKPLDGVTEAVQEARSLAGLLISTADGMLTLTTRQLTALQRVRRQLAGQLPAEVTGPIPDASVETAGAEGLSSRDLAGLRDVIGPSGLTGTFDALGAGTRADVETDGQASTNITPLTRPLPAVVPDAEEQPPTAKPAQKSRAGRGEVARAAYADLLDLWHALTELDDETRAVDRTIAKLVRDASGQEKALRSADGDIAYLRQALTAIRGSVDSLQQLAGTGLGMPQPQEPPPPGGAPRTGSPNAGPPQAPSPSRGPGVGPVVPPPETLAELGTATPMPLDPTGETPSPGSLRAADLLQFSGDFSALARQEDTPENGNGNGNGNAKGQGSHVDEETEGWG